MAISQLEEEPVELGFRQWIGSFLFDWVLRRHDKERLLKPVDGTAHGDAVLLHGFQQSGLRLRRGSVDFVGQNNLGKQRTGLEAEDALAVNPFTDDVGADDVRWHQVWGELNAVEIEIDCLAECADQQGLAQAGDAFK